VTGAPFDLASVLAAVPDPVLVLGTDFRLVWANAACDRSLGRPLSAEVGVSMLDVVHPDDLAFAFAALDNLHRMEVGRLADVRVRTGDGRWCYWEVRGVDRTTDAAVGGYVIAARDVTDRKQLEFSGGDEAMAAVAAQLSGSIIAVVGRDGLVRGVNGAVTRLLGHHPGNCVGRPVGDFLDEADLPLAERMVTDIPESGRASMDVLMVHADGSRVPVDVTVINLCDDPVIDGYLVSGQPAFGLRAARERAEYLARHDPLTGLLNRAGFYEEAVKLTSADGELVGVLVLDLDRFTAINDLLGEEVGDEVLATVAHRLGRAVRRSDLLARLGGDQFLIASVADGPAVFDHVRTRVEAAFADPIRVGEHELRVSCSYGAAHGRAGTAVDWLVADAEMQLNEHRRFHVEPMAPVGTVSVERRALIDELTRAVEQDQLHCWFQPIVDARRGLRAFEALLRWEHPLRGIVGPSEFLPLMAFAGMDEVVDRLVLDQALAHAARVDEAAPGCTMHVNVTPRQITRSRFVDDLVDAVRTHRVSPDAVCLEVTETDLLRFDRGAVEALVAVRRRGFRVAIDDFGTGYSSLSHLLELPIDVLKIDRRFTGGLDVDPTATGLVATIVNLAASLQLACVAEGVETPEQHAALDRAGCPLRQGWLYAPALPAFESLVFARAHTPAAEPSARPLPPPRLGPT
jgi:diguanylate cyclase (GGDEF)-like protein/PAS domain S-box-containing protein